MKEILKFKGAAYGCFGNNDGEKAGIRKLWPAVADPPCELRLGGRRILLTHDEASLQRRRRCCAAPKSSSSATRTR